MTQPEADDASDPHSDARGPVGRTDQPRADPDRSRADPDQPRADPDRSRADPDQPRADPDRSRADPDGPRPEPDEPRMDIGILVTIRSLLPNLAPVEQRVAQAVLDDPGGAARRSISDLSRSCGTSATTVVRFCRAVGLRGYPELRLALAAAVAHGGASAVAAASHDISPGDDAALIAKKIAYADAMAVTDTANHLDVNALVDVVNLLATANRIDIYGVGASGFVALDLQQKLQRIGRPAFAWPDPHMAITSAALRGAGDVAVGLSHTGTTVDTIDALREARRNGATTVAVTNFPWSPITEVADFSLLTAARETAFRSGAMTSRIAQLTVVDCLFVVLAQRDLPTTEASLERTYTAAQAKRTRRARRVAPALSSDTTLASPGEATLAPAPAPAPPGGTTLAPAPAPAPPGGTTLAPAPAPAPPGGTTPTPTGDTDSAPPGDTTPASPAP
jgi:DNA-binding MurR/RpiR family transcriptional regulator